MALGEEKAEAEAAAEGAQPYRRWSRGVDPAGPVRGEQSLRLEAEGGPASPVWGADGLPAPACCAGTDSGSPPGVYRLPANNIPEEAARSGPLPPASRGPPGDPPHSVGSQMEEPKLSACKELPQSPLPRAAALCSGHDADTEDDPSPVGSPLGRGLSQQPHVSGFPLPGATAAQLASCSLSASSTGSSLQDHREPVEPQSCSLAKVSSLELVVPQAAPCLLRPGPRLQWSPLPRNSGADSSGLSRRHLSFQAEYWACVLPDSLPPSPDRHSPLWNPNKEYEDLLDYTYPLRPGPQLPQHRNSHVPADPVLQDSGVDLDSFSVSPASTLKSPTNVSPNGPPPEGTALPFSVARESHLKQWPSGVPQKQGNVGVAPWSQLASTPRAPGTRDAPWESRESTPRGAKDSLPMGKHLEVGSSQLRTWDRGWPLPRPEKEKGASQSVRRPACMGYGWRSEDEVDSDDEYLALPTRLTQVSSLLSYLGSFPTLMTLPGGASEGQSSLEVSDSDGPVSLPSDSSQSQLPSEAALRGSGGFESQNCRFVRSFVCPQDSAGEGSLVSSQAPGASLPAVLDPWPSSALAAEGRLPGDEEQGQESLVQCVKTFCCQLEELIRWLYNVADATNPGTPSSPSLAALKSSLQLYRQFKKDIDEHQSLTESVLRRGEILLQCLLDNAPVLKDVLGRIARQSGELESHADRLYDSILTSVDLLAGCALIPENKPMTAKERPSERV